VVADTVMQARRAARKVKLDIDPLPAMLTPWTRTAGAKLCAAAGDVRRGDAQPRWPRARTR
jgi:xanthine dehydrogenase large subunit